MTTPRGRHNRQDLIYRDMLKRQGLLGGTITDERFDAIVDKVIEMLFRTDPNDWNSSQWQIFKMIFQDRKVRAKETEEETPPSAMSSDDLRAYLPGNRSS